MKEDEDADHIISAFEFARQFWLRIGWNPDDIHHVETREHVEHHAPPSDTSESYIDLDPCLLLGIVEAPTRMWCSEASPLAWTDWSWPARPRHNFGSAASLETLLCCLSSRAQ